MHEVDAKLARWKDLHEQHKDAQARLNESLSAGDGVLAISKLRAEVAALGKSSSAALVAVQEALAEYKSRPSQPASLQ
jgi:hypothetical protein